MHHRSQRPPSAPRAAVRSKEPTLGSPGAAKASPPIGTALIWGGSGFIVGAIFWHTIGFWDFMTAVILGSPESRHRQPDAANGWSTHVIATPTPGRSPSKRPVVAGNCTTLAIDRTKGATASKPCPAILPTAPASVATKADRLPGIAIPAVDQSETAVVGATPATPLAPDASIETSSVRFIAPWLAETHPAKAN